jgi:hypothetical protein
MIYYRIESDITFDVCLKNTIKMIYYRIES